MDGGNILQSPCCVVQQIVFNAFLGGIPHFMARTKWSSPDTFLVLTCDIYNNNVLTKFSNTVA